MAEWRIAEERPVRELDTLNYERCAALHNLIVELGWTQRGLKLNKRTWWQCYKGGAALASIFSRLHPSVVSFLGAAWHGFALSYSEPTHDFH